MAAARSALAQTYTDIEIVICDDSRDDASARAVADLTADPRVRYSRNERRFGQSGNINRLFDLARGERLVLLHDDDLLLPDAVETLDKCWRENPGLLACYGKQQIINHSGTVLEDLTASADAGCSRTAQLEGVQASKMRAVLSGQFPPDAFMVSTAAARVTRFPPEARTGAECDLDFRLRLQACGGAFYFVNRYLSQYRITDRSVASNAIDVDYGFEMVLALRLPRELEPDRLRFLQARVPVAVRRYLVFGKRRKAWALLREPQYWPRGRMSAAQIANSVLFVLPQPLIRLLRALKHEARARLRRSPRAYEWLASARRIVSKLRRTAGGSRHTKVEPGAR